MTHEMNNDTPTTVLFWEVQQQIKMTLNYILLNKSL